ncbi:PREDICTED: aminopeptidase N-like, partial [Trachymyrmex cornetzi]|uniref:aminopeptidase N-like n=1 Tax=Trachymyrmex cornetzi TaxID=471704 RepID=UPI00084EE452
MRTAVFYLSEHPIFDDVLTPDLYTIKIQFFGQLLKKYAQNFFEYSDSNDEKDVTWLIAPTIQATGLGQLFPCWSEAHLKATFKMSMNHHRNYTVLFNMPVQANDSTDKNYWWTHFHVTPPMSNLQIAIVLTTFSHIRINENITLWCGKCSDQQSANLKFVKSLIENITLHLQSEFSEIIIPKMDHIAIPNFPYDVTSKWGLIFHREADLVYDEQVDTVMRKIKIARLVAPKIAYQWFSNVLSMSWWSHFWLHDGLATLFGEEAIVKIFNKPKLMDFFVVQSQYDSLHLDSHDINMNPAKINNLSEIDAIFSFPRSMKVLVILRMFQNEISTEVFRKNVLTYLRKHTFSSNSYKFSPIHEILYSEIRYIPNEFLTWIENERYPDVSWIHFETWSSSGTKGKLLQMYGDSYGKWWIPVTLYYPLVNIDVRKVFLSPENPIASVRSNPKDWKIVNFEQAGYFRANYDTTTVYRVEQLLNMAKGPMWKNISAINRAKIIDDAFHFKMERKFNGSFWELTKHLMEDTDYVAWYPTIKILEYMSCLIPFLNNQDVHFDYTLRNIRRLLGKPFHKLGVTEYPMDDEFTKYLRQDIMRLSCSYRFQDCVITAYDVLKQHLEDPKKNRNSRLLPGWKHWTYCKGLLWGNNFMWFNILIRKWFTNPPEKYELLPYLACSGLSVNSSLLFIEQFAQGKRQEIESYNRIYINLFHIVCTKLAIDYASLEYIFEKHLDKKPKEVNALTALVDIINHICVKTDLMKVSKDNNNNL